MAKVRNPKPRQGKYYGAEIVNVEGANGTWLEGEEFSYPGGAMDRRCYAVCEDGKKRVVNVGIPDTFFSIPGYSRPAGRYVRGFVSSDEEKGFLFHEYKPAAEQPEGEDHGETETTDPNQQSFPEAATVDAA